MLLQQQQRNSISMGSGLPHHLDSDSDTYYPQYDSNRPYSEKQNNDDSLIRPKGNGSITRNQYEQHTVPSQPKQYTSTKAYGSRGVGSPLPTNNLPPHKQHKLYKRHMASSSTPEHYSRNNEGSVVVAHTYSPGKCSNASSLENIVTSKRVDSLGTLQGSVTKDAIAQPYGNASVPKDEQKYDALPHVVSSTLVTSGAPPQFWADSSCHDDDDPPSQLSGANMHLSLASSISGGVAEHHEIPPPIPPHGRSSIISPPTLNSRHTESRLKSSQSPSHLEKKGSVHTVGYVNSGSGRREDEDVSSPE